MDDSVKLLQLLKGLTQDTGQITGLKVVRVNTTEPKPYTFLFEGTKKVLDFDIFEVPVGLYPLCLGDRFLAYPLMNQGLSQRWGLLVKLNNHIIMAKMTGPTSCRVPGIGRDYTAKDLIIPPYFSMDNALSTDGHCGHTYLTITDIRPLQAGDKVSLAPTMDGGEIKYVILEYY
jgi:hypothetical protein